MSAKDHFCLDGKDIPIFIIGFAVIFVVGFIIAATMDIIASNKRAEHAKANAPKPVLIKEFSYNDEEVRIYKDSSTNEIYGEIVNDNN